MTLFKYVVCGLVAGAMSMGAGRLEAQEMPSEYAAMLTTLGKTGDFTRGVLKVNIPRRDLRVVIGQRQAPTPPTRVLFICPHGAAKSVLASAYFARMAKARGLNVVVDFAGTEPDSTVAPKVVERLKEQGFTPPAHPRRVTSSDLASADLVVSIGCDLAGLSPRTGTLRTWDDVPAPSADFGAADAAILKRVTALVEELIRSRN